MNAEEALLAEITRAETSERIAKSVVRTAITAVIAAAPGLLDEYHAARRHVIALQAALSVVGEFLPNSEMMSWQSIPIYPPQAIDPAPATAWRNAIEALSRDAAAPLPEP